MQLQVWKRTIFFGLALWLIFFTMVALLLLLGLTQRAVPTDVVLTLLALVVYWSFASRLNLISVSQGFLVGGSWLLINLLLDYLIIVQGFNHGSLGFFLAWVVWVRYGLLLVMPVISSSRRQVTP